MLSIKEACRYANFLNNTISSLRYELEYGDVSTKTVEKHLKSKAVKDLEDEVIDVTPERRYDIKSHDLSHLIYSLIKDKLILSIAINDAKKDLEIDWKENGKSLNLDSAVEYNKTLRELAKRSLSGLKEYKNSESIKNGKVFVSNVEGNQVPYIYQIEVTETIDFDKNVINNLYKKILKDTDSISELIDEAMLKKVVDYTPKHDLHDSIEDIVNDYVSKLNKES